MHGDLRTPWLSLQTKTARQINRNTVKIARAGINEHQTAHARHENGNKNRTPAGMACVGIDEHHGPRYMRGKPHTPGLVCDLKTCQTQNSGRNTLRGDPRTPGVSCYMSKGTYKIRRLHRIGGDQRAPGSSCHLSKLNVTLLI